MTHSTDKRALIYLISGLNEALKQTEPRDMGENAASALGRLAAQIEPLLRYTPSQKPYFPGIRRPRTHEETVLQSNAEGTRLLLEKLDWDDIEGTQLQLNLNALLTKIRQILGDAPPPPKPTIEEVWLLLLQTEDWEMFSSAAKDSLRAMLGPKS